MAVNTVLFLTADSIAFFIIIVSIVSALVNAYFAAYASVLVTFNYEFRNQVSLHQISLPAKTSAVFGLLVFSLPTTGSPPLGHQNLSRFGETNRMADSSDDRYR